MMTHQSAGDSTGYCFRRAIRSKFSRQRKIFLRTNRTGVHRVLCSISECPESTASICRTLARQQRDEQIVFITGHADVPMSVKAP
jgi:FixJ family two-component response regulator